MLCRIETKAKRRKRRLKEESSLACQFVMSPKAIHAWRMKDSAACRKFSELFVSSFKGVKALLLVSQYLKMTYGRLPSPCGDVGLAPSEYCKGARLECT